MENSRKCKDKEPMKKIHIQLPPSQRERERESERERETHKHQIEKEKEKHSTLRKQVKIMLTSQLVPNININASRSARF